MSRVFGKRSLDNLKTCHPALQRVARRALELTAQDFTIIEGNRSKADQDAAYARGASKVRYPSSAHNPQPSCALDVIPYPFKDWNDYEGWKEIARAFFTASKELNIPIRWGGNWGINNVDERGTKFVDSPHFELHPWRDWSSGKLK